MNDGKYFSFSTTVMNAPCYIPFESMLFSRRVGRASTHGERSSLYTSYLKVAMWWYRNSQDLKTPDKNRNKKNQGTGTVTKHHNAKLIAGDLGPEKSKHPLPPLALAGITLLALFGLDLDTVLLYTARKRLI